jgi:hypothetical protein
MVHSPDFSIVTVVPDTVQIPVVVLVNATGNPDVAVALREKVLGEKLRSETALKVIVCEAFETTKL